MRETFESVCVPGLELNISPSHQGIALTVTMDGELASGQGITLSREDAASIMMAIAEAAGVEPKNGVSLYGTPGHLRAIAFELSEYDKHLAKRTAEAREQAELEAEALELRNAYMNQIGRTNGEAILALAYEQRTATLVHALLSDSLVTDGKYDELQAEVRERLGLGETK